MRAILGLGMLAAIAAAGCVRSIDPAAHSGADGKYKGARAITLDAGPGGIAGEASGVVTYPGGDRVDWKKIELPADQTGTLTLELQWRAPRPGLDLAFEVWTQWGDKVGGVEARKWNQSRRSARRANGTKTTTIDNVKGTVFVSVFASNRGDAGRYKLAATFTPAIGQYDPKFDELLQEMLANGTVIPDPPKLAAVFPPCGDEYDKNNPDCPDNPPPCNRAKPDKNNPSCKHLCDEAKLDPKNPDCKQFYQCTTATWEDPVINPACADVEPPAAVVPDPIYGTIVSKDIQNGVIIITIAVDKKDGAAIQKGWKGSILDKSSSAKTPLAKGGFEIWKEQVATKGQVFAKVPGLSLDEIGRNPNVVIWPPGAEPK